MKTFGNSVALKIIQYMYSEKCLNRTSFGPAFVFGIDRYLAYTCSMNKELLLHTWHPSCYSFYTPGKDAWGKDQIVITTDGTFALLRNKTNYV